MRTVILGISGSIAAYKAADIALGLIERDYDVHTVMTKTAAGFITPMTMQALTKNRVYTEVMQEDDPSQIVHVALPQRADMILVAPATANIIAKIAGGIADDMLTSMLLAAHDIPRLIAPTMNTWMLENPATQENLRRLESRGWIYIEPREARLAEGKVGKGALAEVDVIVNTVIKAGDDIYV